MLFSMIPSTVCTTSSAPIGISLSCTSPAVSVGEILHSCLRMMPPVSMSLSIMNVVTPVIFSPLITAQLIGAAPRYCGSRAACRLNVPSLGMDHTSSGSMRNATTTKMSAFQAARALRNSESFNFTGCNIGKPFSTANFFTALSLTFSPRPLGLSATVTTPTTLYPPSSSALSGATANSGVPIYTILVFLNILIALLLIFLHHVLKFSVLIRAESLTAFHVKYIPRGNRTTVDTNTPTAADTAPSLASFVPVMSITQYKTKNRTAIMADIPSPPLRINAPKGAPIKNRIKHASASANFFSSSTSVLRRMKT